MCWSSPPQDLKILGIEVISVKLTIGELLVSDIGISCFDDYYLASTLVNVLMRS